MKAQLSVLRAVLATTNGAPTEVSLGWRPSAQKKRRPAAALLAGDFRPSDLATAFSALLVILLRFPAANRLNPMRTDWLRQLCQLCQLCQLWKTSSAPLAHR